jgi:transcriptional regulator with PAS, ATPase and Fis domain
VEIPYSSIELIAAVREGRKLSDKIAIVGFESLVQAGKQIQPLFDVALHTELVFRENDMENAVKRLAGEGFRVFIGGTTPVTAARQVGAVGIYIDINIQNIRHAIQESLRIMQLQAEKEARFEATNSILNCVSEGVIGVDINGIVNEINANALSLLHKERAGVINRSLKEILPGIRIEETLERGLERFGR